VTSCTTSPTGIISKLATSTSRCSWAGLPRSCALLIVVTGLIARELGGGRMAQILAGVAALFCLNFMATGSIFSMDVLDQLWWALASLIVARLLRRDAPRLWLLVGLVAAIALLTKLTVLFFGLALFVTPERRYLRTRWPWLAGGVAFLGLLPYLIWNATSGWPTVEFWHHYGGIGTSPLDFFGSELPLMNPIAIPLAVAGLIFYFRKSGARFRLLGWTFVFVYLVLALLRTKPYFLAPDVMPILPPATAVHIYKTIPQALEDRLGWDSLTNTVERVYAGLPPKQRCAYCVDFEKDVPIVVLSDPRVSNIIKQWPSVKHYD
jgi:hypothetical protein